MKSLSIRKFVMLSTSLLIGLALGCSSIAPRNYAVEDAVLFYEPEIVTLSGVLMRATQPGPPNWESIEAGDKAVSFWYLKSERAYSIRNSDPDYETYEGDYNYPREGVSEFMLHSRSPNRTLSRASRLSSPAHCMAVIPDGTSSPSS